MKVKMKKIKDKMETKMTKKSKSKNKKISTNLTSMSRDKEDQKDKKTNTNRKLMVIGPKICYPLLKNLILI